MPLLKWSDSLSVNVVEIDKQHQNLIRIVNDLYDAMLQRKGKEVLGKTINGLIEYVLTHFITEEKYFDKFGYPDANSHKNEHTDFANKLALFTVEFDAGRTDLTLEIMDFLVDWLHNHLQTEDMKYRSFFNEKGLK